MQIVQTVADLREVLKAKSHQGQNIGFVPTMGNLHAGHIALVTLAKQHATCVVASIFVNPLQFSPTEDLASYPRTLEADCEKLKAAGCDIVFTPSVVEIYADFDGKNLNQSMTIMPPPIANVLCGATRLSHFAGVATVVMKLFNIVFYNTVQPNVAIFGKKDFQQLFIIKEMVRQFNLPIEIIAGETVREASGLALSSRNGYLSDAQKVQASQLHNALQGIVNAIKNGNDDFAQLEQQTTAQLTEQDWEVDYISIRSSTTLQPASTTDQEIIVLGAAKITNKTSGKTRLIDNIECLL
jgi:pantoate--beta-alanine ligase